MIWIETPTNPLLKLIDIQAVADVAHKSEVSLEKVFQIIKLIRTIIQYTYAVYLSLLGPLPCMVKKQDRTDTIAVMFRFSFKIFVAFYSNHECTRFSFIRSVFCYLYCISSNEVKFGETVFNYEIKNIERFDISTKEVKIAVTWERSSSLGSRSEDKDKIKDRNRAKIIFKIDSMRSK